MYSNRYYFTRFDLQDIRDAFECREALEGIAARKAAVKNDKRTDSGIV